MFARAFTPTDLAAEMGHTNCALKLMDLGMNVRVRDAYRGSAAALADLKQHAHTAAAIRNYKVDVPSCAPIFSGGRRDECWWMGG